VNPATGNAAVTTREFSIKGAGIDLNVAHTSQSLDTAGLGSLGYGWTSSLSGARLTLYQGGQAVDAQTMFYTDGSGGQWTYLRNKNLDTTWDRPTGLDVDLVGINAGAGYQLTDRKSKVVTRYKDIGNVTTQIYGLDTITDKNGNKITFNYDASARSPIDNTLLLRSVTDTRGRTLTVTNASGNRFDYLTDSANRNVIYDVASNQLNKITDAAGGLVRYEYDVAHHVTAVTTPENFRTEMVYDGTGRITKLTRKNTTGDSVWTFAYTAFTRTNGAPATKTTVTDPDQHAIEYTSDGRGLNKEVKNALGKSVKKTYSPNDDVAVTTAATGAGSQNTTNGYDGADTYRVTSTSIATGSGTQYGYGTGAETYNVKTTTDAQPHHGAVLRRRRQPDRDQECRRDAHPQPVRG
jgi:YD repeat-containing protein